MHCSCCPLPPPPSPLPAGIPVRGGADAPTPNLSALQEPLAAALSAEVLRRLVSLLRERATLGLPPRQRLALLLPQWLATRDFTYSQLCELLPQDLQHSPLVGEVLAEVAVFKPASLVAAGRYSISRASWEVSRRACCIVPSGASPT
jgi:hypothetical protein